MFWKPKMIKDQEKPTLVGASSPAAAGSPRVWE